MKMKHLALAVALGLSLPQVALANTTTSSSSMRGVITTPTGQPAIGKTVTIVHVPTGSRTVVQTNDSGVFNAVGLRVGGPYRVEIDSNVFTARTINDVFLALGETAALNVQLDQDTSVERIVISARQTAVNFDMTGPSSIFGLAEIEATPTIDRDIKNIIEQDPRITIDASNQNAIQCAGGSNRSNSLTVDGIRMNDNFGLNNNGFPTERLPFPFDAIDQVALELAPFDVTYGGFTGCAINAVTKSGSNEVFGSVFVDYRSDSLQGDKIEGNPVTFPAFNEVRYGVTLGLPLVQDKLFAFIAFEKHNPVTNFPFGPAEAGFSSPVRDLTLADVNRVAAAARDVYGYNVADLTNKDDNDERKILAKIDWQINQEHRAFITYQDTKGDTTARADSSNTQFAFSDHFYKRSNHLRSIAGQLFSDWTNDFSTMVRVGWQDVNNGQNPLASQLDFGHVEIRNGGNTIYLGPDRSRHANKLEYDTLSLRLEGKYFYGDHTITGGVEVERTNVFNMFIQNAKGRYYFNSIADFEAGRANRIDYSNAPSLNPADGAASFKLNNETLYLQDKFSVNPDLTITYGLRYDRWSTDEAPTANANFQTRYGFSNAQKLSIDLLQPRFGFNYQFDDVTVIYGGAGLFSGGNPNVWISNSFSNDGRSVLSSTTNDNRISADDRAAALLASNTPNFGFQIPGLLTDPRYFTGGDGAVAATDPNFKAPANWKFNIGTQREVIDNLMVGLDLIVSKEKDPAVVRDLRLTQTDTAPDGRPIYSNCVVNVNNPSGACVRRAIGDVLLTNSDESATSKVASIFTDWRPSRAWRVRGGYTFQSVKETHPMTSSVASSNYTGIITDDPMNPRPGTSNYETPHRFTLQTTYTANWFGDYRTRFSLNAQKVKGRGFSYTFFGDPGFGDDLGGTNNNQRNLLYVPAVNDSRVVYGSGFDVAAFNQFIADSGLEKYRGQIAPRNGFNSSWWSRVDLKISQEIPGFMDGHKGSIYLTIQNLGNLLNDDWGVRKQVGFPYREAVVTGTINADGQYVYNSFRSPVGERVLDNSSVWSAMIGLEYKF